MVPEVWVTEVGGSRLVQVPAAAIVALSRTDGRGQTATASLTIDRLYKLDDDSWLLHQFERYTRELQIVEDGTVVFWGPVKTINRDPGGPTVTVAASGADDWLSVVLIPTEDPPWSREWLSNPDFEDELGAWGIVLPGPVSNSTDQETGSFCIDLDGGAIAQDVAFTLSPEWKVRVQARVWVGASVPDSTPILRLSSVGTSFGVQSRAPASEVTDEEWGWLVRDVILRNPAGGPGVSLTIEVAGSGVDTVLVDRVSVQVSAESLGIPSAAPAARYLTQQVAFQSIVNAVTGEEPAYNLSPTADTAGRVINAPWAQRRDVFASEGLRALVAAADGIEWSMSYTTTDRYANMTTLVGEEHAPGSLTLDASPGGNVLAVGGWESGTERPVTEWLVMDDGGFIGSYRDTAAFDGLLMQELSQAPTGTASSELEQMAQKFAEEASSPLTERLTLVCGLDLLADLGHWGDRVWLIVDDGPDQYDDWVRVEAVQVVYGAAGWLQLSVSRWEDGS